MCLVKKCVPSLKFPGGDFFRHTATIYYWTYGGSAFYRNRAGAMFANSLLTLPRNARSLETRSAKLEQNNKTGQSTDRF